MHMVPKRRIGWGDARKSRLSSPREPLMLLTEFAEEVGQSMRSLSSFLANDAKNGRPHPKPLDSARNANLRQHYYRPSELRQWWTNRQSQESSNVKADD